MQSEIISLEELFGTILDGSTQMIQVSDLDTFQMLYANKPAMAYAGHDGAPFAGQPCYRYMMGYDAQCPFCPLRDMEDPDSAESEVDNGKEIYKVKTKRLTHRGRRLFIEYAEDVTQLRRYEKNMENMLADMKFSEKQPEMERS